jgi:hypothetical protein
MKLPGPQLPELSLNQHAPEFSFLMSKFRVKFPIPVGALTVKDFDILAPLVNPLKSATEGLLPFVSPLHQ